jgi:uncharacterized Rmd1/YagE family protein
MSQWSRTRYIVVFNYGAIVLFNFGINEECDCLDVIRQHCSEQCQEAKKDGELYKMRSWFSSNNIFVSELVAIEYLQAC